MQHFLKHSDNCFRYYGLQQALYKPTIPWPGTRRPESDSKDKSYIGMTGTGYKGKYWEVALKIKIPTIWDYPIFHKHPALTYFER